jgi:hypothetical protein
VTLFLTLGFVAPLVVAPGLTNGHLGTDELLIGGFTLFAAARLGFLFAVGRSAPVEIAFWLFAYLWGGLAPLAQTAVDLFPIGGAYTSAQRSEASAMAWLAGLSFLAGTTLHVRPTGLRGRPWTDRELSAQRLMICGIVGAVAIAITAVAIGGISAYFTPRSAIQAASDAATKGSLAEGAVIGAVKGVPVIVALYGLLTLYRRRGSLTVGQWWVVAITAFGVLLVANPISSARYVFGTAGLAMLAALFPLHTPRSVRLAMLGLLASLIVVFPLADLARRGYHPSQGVTVVSAALLTQDYDAFQQSMNTVEFVRRHGHTDGRQALSAAFFFVPRQVWHGKGNDTGVIVGEDLGYRSTNLSCPLWAEAYVDFGWLGVIVGLGLFGMFARELDARYSRADRSILASFVPVFAAYEFLLVRGSLLQAMGNIAALAVVMFLCSERPSDAGPAPQAGVPVRAGAPEYGT